MNAALVVTLRPSPCRFLLRLSFALALLLVIPFHARAAEAPADALAQFRSDIQPVLSKYCYDCHADGANGRAGGGAAR